MATFISKEYVKKLVEDAHRLRIRQISLGDTHFTIDFYEAVIPWPEVQEVKSQFSNWMSDEKHVSVDDINFPGPVRK